MKEYSISRCELLPDLLCKITPNFIYNRFDLWDISHLDGEISLWKYSEQEQEIFYEAYVSNHEAKLGLWLVSIDTEKLSRIVKSVFNTYPYVKVVTMNNVLAPVLGRVITHNHFRIELPQTKEELDYRLSSKGRYNLRREKRILREKFGNYHINHLQPASEKATEAWHFYFDMKKRIQGTEYGLSASEYCKKYHVTDIYSLVIGENNRIAAVFLSCEQCPIVYLENMTYDPSLREFSPGQILYDEYLKILIENKADEIFLLGGDYSYKKRYGSIEDSIFNCVVYRNKVLNLVKWTERRVRRIGHIIKENMRPERSQV